MLGHRTAREGPEAKDSAHGAGLSFFFFREKHGELESIYLYIYRSYLSLANGFLGVNDDLCGGSHPHGELMLIDIK